MFSLGHFVDDIHVCFPVTPLYIPICYIEIIIKEFIKQYFFKLEGFGKIKKPVESYY